MKLLKTYLALLGAVAMLATAQEITRSSSGSRQVPGIPSGSSIVSLDASIEAPKRLRSAMVW